VQTAKRQVVTVALAEGQVTILDSGVKPGQSIVVDGADRLRNGQIVLASAARQRSGQGTGNAAGQGAGNAGGPFTTPNATPIQGAAAGANAAGEGKGTGNHHKKEQQ